MTTPQPWSGERVVDRETAARLIATAFPELSGQPVAPLAEGWDSTVFRVGDEWAFRFPRRAAVIPGLRREIAVLPALASSLPLAIPAPELVAEDDDPADPWPFVGSRFIRGRELVEAGLTQADRSPAAEAVGAFLAGLHATEVSAFGGLLVTDPNGRGTPAGSVEYVRSVLSSLRARQVVEVEQSMARRIDELLDEAAALEAPAGPLVLVHGDLHTRHVLVDDRGAATGVIDWVDVCLADAALDLSIAYLAFVGPSRAALLAAYGAADGLEREQELRARAIAVKLALMLADYASAQRTSALLAESIAGLARAVA